MYFGKTWFSFNYGTFSTAALIKEGVEAGATSLVLANINSTCDAWDFVQYCREEGIRPILGAEIREDNQLLYILLAANNEGYRQINDFLSDHLLAKKPFPPRTEMTAYFPEAAGVFIIYPLGSREPETLGARERIGVLPWEVNKLLKMPVVAHRDKWIIRQPVTFKNKVFYNLHRLLRAIDKNTLLTKLVCEDLADERETFLSQADIMTAFRGYPFIITNTCRLLEACSIEMEFHTDKNKKVYSASKEDDRVLLEKLARDGFRTRYGRNNRAARERLIKELRIIDQMGFTAYYLITWDMIRYAQSRGFYHVGRGSGANSLVAYCLRITDIDPIELDLYFERFLNPHRTSPPDFDIDFSYRERDEIIDYMMKRYGREHTALLGMYTTFQYNATIRELGKVFGLPKEEIDGLADGRYLNGGTGPRAGQTQDKIHRAILQYGALLRDFPSNLSIHPGGILISEEPLSSYCAVHMPPKGFPTTQMDMFVAENIGLYKLDVLSQRGLGHIKECIELVKQNHQVDIDIHDVERFKRDPKIREQLRSGNTIGCFYIESPAMRQLIRKLRCEDYETLVAASSIIRPGISRSGMMQQYIQRYHNPSGYEYPHPKLQELLGTTYGVMIYQEQIIQVAHEWAGLDMADADMLRRATNPKYRGKGMLPALKVKFFENGERLGYDRPVIEEVWQQIENLADFSFCKAHSASYAVESYQSLFLKTYYPMEFAVSVINNFGGFYSRELYFYELMRAGATVHRPCVNHSDYYTNIHDRDAYVGFVHIKGLEQARVSKILSERMRSGPYTGLPDFIERTAIPSEQLDLLIRAGALRFTGRSKKELLWQGDFLQKKNPHHSAAVRPLFQAAPITFELPVLTDHPMEQYYDDVELLGFPVADPFILVEEGAETGCVPARELSGLVGHTVTVLGYHVTHKPVRTIKGETMCFGTFLDSRKDWIDTVHFPQVYAAFGLRSGFYRITGKVVSDFGVYNIEVTRMQKMGVRPRAPQAQATPAGKNLVP